MIGDVNERSCDLGIKFHPRDMCLKCEHEIKAILHALSHSGMVLI